MFNNLFNSLIFSTFTGADRVDLQTTRKGIPIAFPHLYNISDSILNRSKMKTCEVNSERWLSLKDFPHELWKPVVGYETRYLVSNFGRVKSLPTEHRKYTKILHQAKVNEHLTVLTYGDNGRRKQRYVHRLVATAFIPNPYNLPFINHRDENGFNNRVRNLEWCTPKYNSNYGTLRQRISKAMEQYKRPVDKYTMDGHFVETIPSLSEAAPYQDDSTIRHIWECCNGGRRSVKGFIYRYHGEPAPVIKTKNSCIEIKLYQDNNNVETYYGYEELAQKYNIKLGTVQQFSKGQKPKKLKPYKITVTRITQKYTKVIYKD